MGHHSVKKRSKASIPIELGIGHVRAAAAFHAASTKAICVMTLSRTRNMNSGLIRKAQENFKAPVSCRSIGPPRPMELGFGNDCSNLELAA
jgi:hypothetical protein